MDDPGETPGDGSALNPWDQLPPHLQEALRGAMEGLSDAFGDVSHPLGPQLQRMWEVADQIEAYALSKEQISAERG